MRLRLPLEAARTRLALAGILTDQDAVSEARAALAAFETLGAARDADQAAARLREFGLRNRAEAAAYVVRHAAERHSTN